MQTLTDQSACNKRRQSCIQFWRSSVDVSFIRISDATYLGLLRRLSGVRAPQFMLDLPERHHCHILRLIAAKNVNIQSLKATTLYDVGDADLDRPKCMQKRRQNCIHFWRSSEDVSFIKISDATYLGLLRRLSGVRAFQFMLELPGAAAPPHN